MPPTKESFGFYKKGKIWWCPCNKRAIYCVSNECKRIGAIVDIKIGGAMCEHNRVRTSCKECGGSQICNHHRVRACCKECGGSQICNHNRVRACCKECGGSSICKHNRERTRCIPCGGSQICDHDRIRNQCHECGGSRICQHNKQRAHCRKCGGSQICKHNIQRSQCKQCVGSGICEHDKIRRTCRECKGTCICTHDKRRRDCNICDPVGHIIGLRRKRRKYASNSKNPTHTLDDLGMTSKEWLVHLNKTFEDTYGRSRTDDDDVHIDEIIPCSAWNLPEDNRYCWHYLNSQWLLASDNLSKSTSYTEEDREDMIKRINEHLSDIKM